MSYEDGIYCIAPAERNNPVRMFEITKFESVAFPVQFPDGLNTPDDPARAKGVSPVDTLTQNCSVNNRCARDTNYIFF